MLLSGQGALLLELANRQPTMGKKSSNKKAKGSPKAAGDAGDQMEVVDYAATADAFFQGGGLENNSDLELNPPEEDSDDKSESEISKEENFDENEVPDGSEIDQGIVTSSSQSEEEDDADDAGEIGSDGEDINDLDVEDPTFVNGEPCTFDLRNLLALNSHQINAKTLYNTKKHQSKQGVETILMSDQFPRVDEQYLESKAFDGCSQLVHALWQLPKEKSDVGTMIKLPAFDDSRIPRALVSVSCLS